MGRVVFSFYGVVMSMLDVYLRQVRRERIRLWLSFAAANLACLALVLVMFYI